MARRLKEVGPRYALGNTRKSPSPMKKFLSLWKLDSSPDSELSSIGQFGPFIKKLLACLKRLFLRNVAQQLRFIAIMSLVAFPHAAPLRLQINSYVLVKSALLFNTSCLSLKQPMVNYWLQAFQVVCSLFELLPAN